MKYISEFLQFRCSPDVLACSGRVPNCAKEITEAMAMQKAVRGPVLEKPMRFTMHDMCSGNGLVGLVAVFTLPFKEVHCYDKRESKTGFLNAHRFTYHGQTDIYKLEPSFDENTVITACHPCKDLSRQIIKLYNESKAKHLVLMPCCNGSFTAPAFDFLRAELGSYKTWCYDLALGIKNSKVTMSVDKYCSSARNVVIKATKNGQKETKT
jgi:hypothetical protein